MELRTPLPDTEFSAKFLQGMVNRMAVSFHKYGAVAQNYPEKVDALRCAEQRLAMYAETANTECLIDAANFLMIEFMRPSIDDAVFAPTDSDASPGLVAR